MRSEPAKASEVHRAGGRLKRLAAQADRQGVGLRSAIRRRLPRSVPAGWRRVKSGLAKMRSASAARAFARAGVAPAYLGAAELDALAVEYAGAPRYSFEPEALLQRGELRAARLFDLMLGERVERVLEVGCQDGMVGAALERRGWRATGVDLRTAGFDARARAAGVRFHAMNAERMAFESGSFDLAFSYNSFEHFQDPAAVLEEMSRVVRSGGYVFLFFCPLYLSPFGEHAQATVPVPYCQFLFSAEMLADFARRNRLEPIDPSHVNGWPLARYRELWTKVEDRLERLYYREDRDLDHLDLIRRYPSCFRSKCDDFESLVVAGIEVLFRRVA